MKSGGGAGGAGAGGAGAPRQLFGLLGGVTAYAVHLLASTALVPLACEIGSTWPLHLASGVVLSVIIVSGLVAWGVLRAGRVAVGARMDGAAGDRSDPAAGRTSFLGSSGLMLNVLAFTVVVMSEVPNHLLDPCLP